MGCPGRGGLEGPQYGAHADGYPRCSRLFAPELAPRGGREEGVRVVTILVPWAHLFPRAAACDGSRAPARRLASCLGLWPTFFQAHADLRLRAYPRSEQIERPFAQSHSAPAERVGFAPGASTSRKRAPVSTRLPRVRAHDLDHCA